MARPEKHRERELAFQTLYGLSFSPAQNEEEVKSAFLLSPHNPRPEADPQGLAWELVSGVWRREKELNSEIEKFSLNWSAGRIGRIEMILLRLALYEMFYLRTPSRVVISENLDLARQFGAEGALSFINGVLDAAARARPEVASRHLAK